MKAVILSNVTSSSNIIASFQETGIEFELINTETNSNYKVVPDNKNQIEVLANIYEGINSKLMKFFRFIFGIPFFARLFGNPLLSIKSIPFPKNADFIFANWGAGIVPEINLIKESLEIADLKTILNLESFPTSWDSSFRESFEIYMLKKSLKNIDAFIIPSEKMASFLKKEIPEISKKKIYHTPYYFPRSFFKRNEELNEPSKDLIFLGQLSLNNELNNVKNQILNITENNIVVTCVNKKIESNIKNLYFFPPFASSFLLSGELHALAHNHKAALATYYLPEKEKIPKRYITSLPHRFLMPLALGIPVVLPKNYFPSMQALIEKHEIGLAYSSIEELKKFLSGNDWKIAKENLKKKQAQFLFNPDTFIDFCRSVIH